MPMGVACLVTWRRCAFSFGRFNIPRPAIIFKQLLTCIFLFTILCPSKPCPFSQSKTDVNAHAQIFTAQMYSFGYWAFKRACPPAKLLPWALAPTCHRWGRSSAGATPASQSWTAVSKHLGPAPRPSARQGAERALLSVAGEWPF